MNDHDQRWAIFWCSLLQPLLFEEVTGKQAARLLRELAGTEVLFPDGQRRKPALSTLRRKWKRYRAGGFEALARKRRRDRGQPRTASPEMIQRAIELKTEQPLRSDETINRFLQREFNGRTLPKSTLYRHLKRAGATRLKLGVTQTKVRTRYQREKDAHPATARKPRGKPKHNYLDMLVEQHDQALDAASQGIDYRKVPAARAWPFHQFVKTLAALLGKNGGLSAFRADELELLQKLFQRLECDEPMLRQAVGLAQPKTLPTIAFHLQHLHDERDR